MQMDWFIDVENMGTAAEALEKNLILAERRFRDIANGGKEYDGEKIEILMKKLWEAYDTLVEHEQRLIRQASNATSDAE
jgi:hypothetical protein